MRLFNRHPVKKVVPEFHPMRSVEEMNAALTASEKLCFQYVDLELLIEKGGEHEQL